MQVKLESIELASPWQAALLRVSAFPIPAGELQPIRLLLRAFSEVLTGEHALHHEILLQLWNLSPQTGSNVLNAHMDEWAPDFGLGVWPNREAPQGWTEELLVDAAAAVFRGDEPQRPSHRLLRLTGEASKRQDAAAEMRGFGVQIELFSKDTIDTIEDHGRKLFLPLITESRFQREPFYLPVLDRTCLNSANSAEQLQQWLCGVDVYVRESAEDKGILILSQVPLEPLFDRSKRKLLEDQAALDLAK